MAEFADDRPKQGGPSCNRRFRSVRYTSSDSFELAHVVGQIPGGALIDAMRRKRLLIAVGTLMIAASAVLLASRDGAVAICVGICLAQSPVERAYWIRQRGQSAR